MFRVCSTVNRSGSSGLKWVWKSVLYDQDILINHKLEALAITGTPSSIRTRIGGITGKHKIGVKYKSKPYVARPDPIYPNPGVEHVQGLATENLNMTESNRFLVQETLKLLRNPNSAEPKVQVSGSETSTKKLLRQMSGNSEESGASDTPEDVFKANRPRLANVQPVDTSQVAQSDQWVLKECKRLKQNPDFSDMHDKRRGLPAWNSQQEILEALDKHQALVICGATGCGKTTQVPQFILDASIEKMLSGSGGKLANIVITQPRRISALNVAYRVASERCDKVGNHVGYHIRLQSRMGPMTRLLYCTAGILLRRLERDTLMSSVTHIILDEVHERSHETDFMMLVLREILRDRPELKVILMSATVDASMFAKYFNNCPVLEIPGLTHTVQQIFLEDAVELSGYNNDMYDKYQNATGKPSPGNENVPMSTLTLEEHFDKFKQAKECQAKVGNRAVIRPPKPSRLDQICTVPQLMGRYPGYSPRTLRVIRTHCRSPDADVHLKVVNKLGQNYLKTHGGEQPAKFEQENMAVDFKLLESVLTYCVHGNHGYKKNGAVLIFLPGYEDIRQFYDQLNVSAEFKKSEYWVMPLHGVLNTKDQEDVFVETPEKVTKIVLATNIAETSITLTDIVYIIDCGFHKVQMYDPFKHMDSLNMAWISKANAIQRKGRAGRVASGLCFHLYSSYFHTHKLQEHPVPEIHRVNLEDLVLRSKSLGVFADSSVDSVFSRLMEPPKTINLNAAIRRLQSQGALDDNENLTSLGYHLARLPVDIKIGKLMLYGVVFGCLDPALTIAAGLSYRSPFLAPFDKRHEAEIKKKALAGDSNSDQIALVNAFDQWEKECSKGPMNSSEFCYHNFLNENVMRMLSQVKDQLASLLAQVGFLDKNYKTERLRYKNKRTALTRSIEVKSREKLSYEYDAFEEFDRIDQNNDSKYQNIVDIANRNSSNHKLITALLVGSLYPNVLRIKEAEVVHRDTSDNRNRRPTRYGAEFITKEDGEVWIHPSSVNFKLSEISSPYMVFHEKVRTSRIFIRDCTMVHAFPLLLFGGQKIRIPNWNQLKMYIDKQQFIGFNASHPDESLMLYSLRKAVDRMFAEKIEHPDLDLVKSERYSTIINTIVQLVTTQEWSSDPQKRFATDDDPKPTYRKPKIRIPHSILEFRTNPNSKKAGQPWRCANCRCKDGFKTCYEYGNREGGAGYQDLLRREKELPWYMTKKAKPYCKN